MSQQCARLVLPVSSTSARKKTGAEAPVSDEPG